MAVVVTVPFAVWFVFHLEEFNNNGEWKWRIRARIARRSADETRARIACRSADGTRARIARRSADGTRARIATFSIFHSQFSITVLEINNEQDYKNCGRIRCRTAERGKSTLTNKLVGQKVAIVSSKPQTTRTRITGVLSRGETQYVLLDTPGLHKPRSRLGDYMCKVVTDTVSEVDVAVLVVEPIPNIGPAEETLIAQIKQHHMPAILVINKIDTVKKEELLAVIAYLRGSA